MSYNSSSNNMLIRAGIIRIEINIIIITINFNIIEAMYGSWAFNV
jgi:hypothetical protein